MAEKKTPDSGYAWATIYYGGETEEARDGRKLVVKRNIINPGDKVTKAKLGSSDEEWEAMFDDTNGSIRSYPLPKMPADFSGSPSEFIMAQLRNNEGEYDTAVLLGLALKHPDTTEVHEAEATK